MDGEIIEEEEFSTCLFLNYDLAPVKGSFHVWSLAAAVFEVVRVIFACMVFRSPMLSSEFS